MGRWSHLDSDDDRLPPGFTRIGYDADSQTYTFRDISDGSLWESAPGARYGTLHRVSTLHPPAPRLPAVHIDTDITGDEAEYVLHDYDDDENSPLSSPTLSSESPGGGDVEKPRRAFMPRGDVTSPVSPSRGSVTGGDQGNNGPEQKERVIPLRLVSSSLSGDTNVSPTTEKSPSVPTSADVHDTAQHQNDNTQVPSSPVERLMRRSSTISRIASILGRRSTVSSVSTGRGDESRLSRASTVTGQTWPGYEYRAGGRPRRATTTFDDMVDANGRRWP